MCGVIKLKRIVIIGGGITGLSTAYYLQQHLEAERLEAAVTLVEAGEQLGGKIRTVRKDGFIMETGADSIVARKMSTGGLIDSLGLKERMVYNSAGRSFLHIDGELKPIPDDAVFGIPISLESLAKSELVSAEGKVAALRDFYTKNETFTKEDSVGAFLKFFLGEELVERQIAPVLSGVYSGNLDELTIASTLPYLLDYKNEYGSIIQGLSENREKFQRAGNQKFLSFNTGLSAFIEAMEEKLERVEIRTLTRAESIEKAEGRYKIRFADRSEMEADAIVIAAMHTAAQRMLHSPELDEEFDRLKTNSLISVYLGFEVPDEALPYDGTGFITAADSPLICDACTWTSRKWRHTSSHNKLLMRLFYKSSNPHYEVLSRMGEEELAETAVQDIKRAVGIEAVPSVRIVTKWEDAMPRYHLGHHEIIASLEEKMERNFPGIYLAGCSYYGVGIPDCIANGEQTARRIADRLQG